ncbi:MAG: thymidine phosphorylase [Pseudomonadota bacterium]
MDAASILTRLRTGETPTDDEIRWFSNGLATGAISDAQAGAFAMAVCQNGLGKEGRVALTAAMRDTGKTLDWALPGPVADKHSTGGIGDCVSLLLAPILAEAGVYVPMISGRGLGHTGGTLDKLEAIPGFKVDQPEDTFRKIVEDVGCAIVSASPDLAPADKRLYAVRDVTGTVPSVDLITASILSKKLAAGLETLVLDVKCGSGAFMQTPDDASTLAEALVSTANAAGCKTAALITEMDQPLCPAVGNALEVAHVMEALTNPKNTRLVRVTVVLCGEILALAKMASSPEAGYAIADRMLTDGRALSRFGRMVAAQGGPTDFAENWKAHLSSDTPVVQEVRAPATGRVAAIDAAAIGRAVVHLGGGRLRDGDDIDHRVGFTGLPQIGAQVTKGDPIAQIHARDEGEAKQAAKALLAAYSLTDDTVETPPLIYERIGP